MAICVAPFPTLFSSLLHSTAAAPPRPSEPAASLLRTSLKLPSSLPSLSCYGERMMHCSAQAAGMGVIWKGDKLIDGVSETLDLLRSMAAYLKSIKFPADKKVYSIGEAGIQLELKQAGINYIGDPEDGDKTIDLAPGQLMEHDHDVAAVVVGFDRHINYYKLHSVNQICMVGDRLDTDILFGQNGGCATLLVLSGVTTLETLQSPENKIPPDFYTNKISDLLAAKEVANA